MSESGLFLFCFVFKFRLYQVLVAALRLLSCGIQTLSCGMQTLNCGMHVGSISLTRIEPRPPALGV